MEKTAILFDLDGTLLPMDQEVFIENYVKLLMGTAASLGYKTETLVRALWQGVEGMSSNDGSQTNDKVFWDIFSETLGSKEEVLSLAPEFLQFYSNEFDQARTAATFNPLAKEAVTLAREKADVVILATNPQFPIEGVNTRLRWTGLEPGDFDDITDYTSCTYCKPNPAYYTEILNKHGIAAENALMVGNDIDEDIKAARSAGLHTYLIKDCQIGRSGGVKTRQGSFAEFVEELKASDGSL